VSRPSLNARVAAHLDQRRRALGLTQMQLATVVGSSQSHISKLLRAERAMRLDEFDALCAAMGVSAVTVLQDAQSGE
jgi:transcriptional regulator with XRE-family HTH domain